MFLQTGTYLVYLTYFRVQSRSKFTDMYTVSCQNAPSYTSSCQHNLLMDYIVLIFATKNKNLNIIVYRPIFKWENRDDNGCSYNFKLTKNTQQAHVEAHVVEHWEPLYCAAIYGHKSQYHSCLFRNFYVIWYY